MATSKLINSSFVKLTLTKPVIGIYPSFHQVRWRKPRWLKVAPSKEFLVRQPTPVNTVESEELELRYRDYRATVAAMRTYLAEDYMRQQKAEEKGATVESSQMFEESLAMAQKWNQEVSLLRVKRQAAEKAAEDEIRRELEAARAAQLLKMMEEAERKITFEKSQKFITLENLDAELEKVLDSQMDYEYAIDNKGYRYTRQGKEPLPIKDEKSRPS